MRDSSPEAPPFIDGAQDLDLSPRLCKGHTAGSLPPTLIDTGHKGRRTTAKWSPHSKPTKLAWKDSITVNGIECHKETPEDQGGHMTDVVLIL